MFLIGLLLILQVTGLPHAAFARQSQRYWITFRDRGPQANLSLVDPQTLGISEHALWRRAKVLPPDRLIDELDLPVNQSYLDQLRSAGIVIRSTSRWFNAASAELTASQRASLANIPFVASVEPVAVSFRREPNVSPPAVQPLFKMKSTAGLDYGPSLTQLSNIKVIDVHNQGITGAGVIIGMLDDGFNQHTVHPALKNITVIAEYDFVQQDSNTSRAPGEYASQGNHGAGTLSAIGGFENGRLIGVAYGASFILGKTEIDSVEIKLEEDLYVAGLEWEERLGAEIVSSSLGYIDWYTYQDLDGRTATTTKAARIAARKGVLLVTAMGNEGKYGPTKPPTTGTMLAPADADSIVSVGAVNSDGILAGFSSTGPTSDGRVKPEVVAQGVSDYVMYGEQGCIYGSGTSFSTPLTAGVAALILSAHPTSTPMQVRDRLISTARALYDTSAGMVTHPNNFYGWGMVDAAKAVAAATGLSGGLTPGQFALLNNYPNPFNESTTIVVQAGGEQQIELAIHNILGQLVRTIYKGKSQAGFNYFQWREGLDDAGYQVASGIYICRLTSSGLVLSQKILYLK
jgi:subtilisin family serine protease